MSFLETKVMVGAFIGVPLLAYGLTYWATESMEKELQEKRSTIEEKAQSLPDVEFRKSILADMKDFGGYCEERPWCVEKELDGLLKELDNYDKSREITVNVGLDGTPRWEAEDLIKKLNEEYQKKFKIKFKVVGFYNHNLTFLLEESTEKLRLENKAKQKSDLYLIFTDNNWPDWYGKALPGKGVMFVETDSCRGCNYNILLHETTHLFDVIQHNSEKGTVMYPKATRKKLRWTPETRRTVTKKKFKRWNL